MNYTGKITGRVIDFDNITETDNTITVNSSYVTISYKDDQNRLIQLKKPISNPKIIYKGDFITSSNTQKDAIGGFGVKSLNSTKKKKHI